jgi:DNA polymerase I-like protein with 3'-5' exonuclease and polymerase domains/intein/homing endonuclease
MADIATGMLDVFTGEAVKELLDLRPWMQGKTFELITKPADVEVYIDKLIEKGICGLDLETTGLNTRLKKDGSRYIEIVGVCLAISPNEGAYIPVLHEDKEYNVPLKFMVQQIKRLTSNCVCVFHNFKYDGEILRNHGIIIENEDMYEDTYLLAAIQDASRREKGLKFLSEHILKRPMIDISELGITGSKKNIVAFSMVPPQTAVYYGASDAMNTLGLFIVLKKEIDKQDPDGKQGPWYIYKIEKRCLFVTMEMERNVVLVNKEYLLKVREDIQGRMKEILTKIHALAGREFDINSPKQLGEVLFDELKIRYPLTEKSASGQFKTDENTLILIENEAPIVNKILSYRGYTKLVGTYIDNFINNLDEDGFAKFQLNQVRADTGRYSASGGKGIDEDGYSGVNCQNIPTYDKSDPDSVDLRKAIIARLGFKIVTVDYSGEELRIAANMSREAKWIQEFNQGTGDLHTITAQIIHGKTDVTKQERGLGKCVSKGTRIATQRGWIPIEDLLPNDKVITHEGNLKDIEQIHDMGTKKAVTIITSSGHKIKCGYNHRFLTPEGSWVRAEDLSIGQEILSSTLQGQRGVTSVKEKECHDSAELMDLTVKDDHTYVAEGLVTHNTLNFHTIYGGGAGGFAVRAKIPVDTAKKMLFNFFSKYNILAKWLVDEAKRAKKRGYSKTAFGRRRPLSEFYSSTDRQVMARGDRCAINSAIQGCLQPQERCLTNKGYIEIKEIEKRKQSGEEFLIWTGTSWEGFDVVNRGKCQFAKIVLENGLRLYCDTRHEVLVVGSRGYVFKKYSDLTSDDSVCVSVPQELEYGDTPEPINFSGGVAHNSKDILLSDVLDYEFITYLIGVCIGDGNVRDITRHSITLCFGKEDFNRHFNKLEKGLNKIGLKFGKVRRSKGSIGESYQASINSKALVSIFNYYGYGSWTAKTKRVPKLIFESPLGCRKSFLRGYFDADGCKKSANRYGFHTANRELLEDVQALAWTTGLASYVKTQSDESHLLVWSDLSEVERVLGLKSEKRKRRTGGAMLLPSFKHKEIYETLKNIPLDSNKDRSLLCNLNKGRKILVPTVAKLLRKYDVSIPLFYYHYKVLEKTEIKKVEDTYTLSVYSDLHRYDSSCIISKNTGADVIKIALYRVWKWLHSNGFDSNDVRILMPIHDEIVYEIREDKLGYFIENIAELMCLDEYTSKLQWPVKFTVDAEYGDSLSVTNDYFKEKRELEKQAALEGSVIPAPKKELVAPKIESPVVAVAPIIETPKKEDIEVTVDNSAEKVVIPEDKGGPEIKMEQHTVVSQNDGNQYINFTVTFKDDQTVKSSDKEEVDSGALSDDRLKNRLDDMGFYVHEVKSFDPMASIHMKTIIDMLNEYDQHFVGVRCRIKLVAPDGTVVHKIYNKVSVDAFESLCFWYNI